MVGEVRVRAAVAGHWGRAEVVQAGEAVVRWVAQQMERLQGEGEFEVVISRGGEREEEGEGEEREELLDPYGYDPELMREQLLLFDCEQQMRNYIETEKILAADPVKQLTELSLCLIKLGQSLLHSRSPLPSLKQQSLSKQRLQEIEGECLATLSRVREQRRRIENCCICLSARSRWVTLPCMHLVLCGECAGPRVQRCPICSQPIRDMREVFQ